MKGVQLSITIAAAGLLGGAIGWGLAQKRMHILEENLEILHDILSKRPTPQPAPPIPYEKADPVEPPSDIPAAPNAGSFYVTPYDKARSEYEEEEPDEPEETVVVHEEPSEELKADGDEPYLISQEVFVANEKGYTHDTFNYFVKDDILVDDEGQIVDNVYFLVGRATEEFDDKDYDKNILFVRNNRTMSEYEITCDWNDWTDSDLDTHRPIYLR